MIAIRYYVIKVGNIITNTGKTSKLRNIIAQYGSTGVYGRSNSYKCAYIMSNSAEATSSLPRLATLYQIIHSHSSTSTHWHINYIDTLTHWNNFYIVISTNWHIDTLTNLPIDTLTNRHWWTVKMYEPTYSRQIKIVNSMNEIGFKCVHFHPWIFFSFLSFVM